MVCDEVGMGRCGLLWGHEQLLGVVPDVFFECQGGMVVFRSIGRCFRGWGLLRGIVI